MTKVTLDEFQALLAVQTVSGATELMEEYIEQFCDSINIDAVYDNGNFYITKGKANFYPCIVAHTDTVHDFQEELLPVVVGSNITGFNPYTMEQAGIGGDDKCGIFIALQMLKKLDVVKIAFFRDEEIGCKGSYDANLDFFLDVGYVIQFDRRGNSDFVTSISGMELSSKRFKHDLTGTLKRHGYKKCTGAMTDVQALKELGINASMCNLSAGYYNPHCPDEFISIEDIDNCLALCENMIKVLGNTHYPHIATRPVYKVTGYKSTYSSRSYDTGKEYREYMSKNNPKNDAYHLPKTKKTKVKGPFECDSCLNQVNGGDLHYSGYYGMWLCADCSIAEEKSRTKSWMF